MEYVLAKVKTGERKNLFKLLSDKSLFEGIDLNADSWVEYSPDHNLDDDGWFKIEMFSEQSYCTIEELKKEFDSKDYDDCPRGNFAKIECLYSIQGADCYFHKVTPSLFVKKKMIAFGECAQLISDNSHLVVNPEPDAVYIKDKDILLFRNLATISSLFKGIDTLYREATQGEVEKFCKNELIHLSGDYTTEKVSKANRKRIAIVKDRFAAMSSDNRSQMVAYITNYCGDEFNFNKDLGSFDISSEKELKYFLYGLEQRFYTTELGGEKRLANSIVVLAQQK